MQWDYTRVKVEEAPDKAALARLQAAGLMGSGNLTARLGDLERQVGKGGRGLAVGLKNLLNLRRPCTYCGLLALLCSCPCCCRRRRKW